jgi:hypothetical protein
MSCRDDYKTLDEGVAKYSIGGGSMSVKPSD